MQHTTVRKIHYFISIWSKYYTIFFTPQIYAVMPDVRMEAHVSPPVSLSTRVLAQPRLQESTVNTVSMLSQ